MGDFWFGGRFRVLTVLAHVSLLCMVVATVRRGWDGDDAGLMMGDGGAFDGGWLKLEFVKASIRLGF